MDDRAVRRRTLLRTSLLFALQGALLFAAVYGAGRALIRNHPDRLAPFLVQVLDDDLRAEVKRALVANSNGVWAVVPDPDVARLGKPNTDFVAAQAAVHFNNAGFRSAIDYTDKSRGTYRIVCLGDSFAFGEGGPEKDRFCDQIGAFFRERNLKIDGKTVETLVVGLSSWTMAQEATYMRTRLSSYDPDLIIMLTVANDITASSGVTGDGRITNSFSPEYHQWGQGFFTNQAGMPFGDPAYTVYTTDLCDACRQQWRRSTAALKSLVDAQKSRGARILLSVSPFTLGGFDQYYKGAVTEAGIDAPVLVTDFGGKSLPHDSHPNREGHGWFAAHYLHAMVKLGWADVPRGQLPALPASLSLAFDARPDGLAAAREHDARAIPDKLDFRALTRGQTFPLLGGFIVDQGQAPWSSVRSGFVLMPKTPRDQRVKLDLELPRVAELYPLTLRVELDGRPAWQQRFASVEDGAGAKHLEVPVPDQGAAARPVQVVMIADRHFARITDWQMRSFQIISAAVGPR